MVLDVLVFVIRESSETNAQERPKTFDRGVSGGVISECTGGEIPEFVGKVPKDFAHEFLRMIRVDLDGYSVPEQDMIPDALSYHGRFPRLAVVELNVPRVEVDHT